jgi:hypothetical protein
MITRRRHQLLAPGSGTWLTAWVPMWRSG